MEQNIEDLTSILFNSLTDLDKESETLNEYVNALSQEVPSAPTLNPAPLDIINDLQPNEESLLSNDELQQFNTQNIEQNQTSETQFKLDNTSKEAPAIVKETTSTPPTISEDEIVNRITANIEKTLGDYSNEQNIDEPKQNIEQSEKPVANKLNSFLNNLAQQPPAKDNSLSEPITSPAKQEEKTFQTISNSEASPKENLLTLDNIQPQTETSLQTLQKNEQNEQAVPETFSNAQPSNNKTLNASPSQSSITKPVLSNPSLFTLKNEPSVASTPSFTGYITNSYEPVLEKYFINEKAQNTQLSPQDISLNDIQNLQKQNNPSLQTSLTQNINEYSNQTLLNTYNNIETSSQELISKPFKQNDISQYTIEQNSIQDNNEELTAKPSNQIKESTAENITYPENKTDFTTFDTDSTESIAEYFDGIDPTLNEILQNTKQTNSVLQQITKALPLLAASNVMNNQQNASPAPTSFSAPSINMPSSVGEGNQSGLQEGIPQIPGIRSKFLVA